VEIVEGWRLLRVNRTLAFTPDGPALLRLKKAMADKAAQISSKKMGIVSGRSAAA